MNQQTMEDLKLTVKPSALLLLSKVSHFLAGEGIQAYLTGGFVRDTLLGRDTADIDIAVATDALEIAPRAAAALGGKYILLDEVNEIGRIVIVNNEIAPDKWEIDFSTLRGTIEEDLAQRDFTIDAIAIELGEINPESLEGDKTTLRFSGLIDPFHGQDDLRQGVIRAISETAFPSDAARLLRAVRLAAELGFSIDSETEAQIRHYNHLITNVARERVRDELLRILETPKAGQVFAYLDELELLTTLIPELAQAKGVEQPLVHFWNVFDHSIRTIGSVEFVLRQGDLEYADAEVLALVPWSAVLSQHFDQEISSGSTRRSLLKLAALLHDIGKPQTKTMDESGRAHFIGHATEGGATASGIMERLRFSTKEIKLVELIIQQHLRPGQMAHDELPSGRAIYRYFRDTGDAGIDILFFSLADHLAARGPNLILNHWREHTKTVEYVLTKRFEEASPATPARLIDGHDIISLFGLSPGPMIGEFLEAVREAQATGEVTTRQEALDYIEHLLAAPSS